MEESTVFLKHEGVFAYNRMSKHSLPDEVLESICKTNAYHPRVYAPFKGCKIQYNYYNKFDDNSYSKLCFSLKGKVYDLVLFFPALRKGGTDKLLISYLISIKKFKKDISILLFLEKETDCDWIDLLPVDIEIFYLSELVDNNDQSKVRSTIATYLFNHTPKVIWGFNSRLSWLLVKEYGDKLSLDCKIWFVCFAHWIHEHSYREFGMIHDYFGDCKEYISCMIGDNQTFLNYLNTQYDLQGIQTKHLPAVIASESFSKKIKREKLKLLWASGIEWNKGIDILIKLSDYAKDMDFEIDIFGATKNPSGDTILKRLIDYTKSNNRVNYKGTFNGFNTLDTDSYDAFLMTSIIEGMPNVLLEAAERQMLIISTNVGGVNEVIKDGQTGFLVNDPLNLDSYLTKIDQLKELNEKDFNSMRLNLNCLIKDKYSQTTFENSFLDIYRS